MRDFFLGPARKLPGDSMRPPTDSEQSFRSGISLTFCPVYYFTYANCCTSRAAVAVCGLSRRTTIKMAVCHGLPPWRCSLRKQLCPECQLKSPVTQPRPLTPRLTTDTLLPVVGCLLSHPASLLTFTQFTEDDARTLPGLVIQNVQVNIFQ